MTDDLISRQAAIDAVDNYIGTFDAIDVNFLDGLKTAKKLVMQLPSAQTNLQPTCNQLATDCISRQAAIDAAALSAAEWDGMYVQDINVRIRKALENLPSAQPTLYGYNVEHLELIARVLQKENLPPERVAEALTDISNIVAIVRDEFEETLRKAVKQCVI